MPSRLLHPLPLGVGIGGVAAQQRRGIIEHNFPHSDVLRAEVRGAAGAPAEALGKCGAR